MSRQEVTYEELTKVLEPVRAHVKNDGGDIRIVDFNGQVLKIELLGACAICGISNASFKEGVYKIVQKRIPQIKDVVIIN